MRSSGKTQILSFAASFRLLSLCQSFMLIEKRFDRIFHLVHSEEVPPNTFELDGKRRDVATSSRSGNGEASGVPFNHPRGPDAPVLASVVPL